MEEQILTCIQCETTFAFSVAEQQRYTDHNFDAPMRCPDCRKKKAKLVDDDHKWNRAGNRKKKRFKKDIDLIV
jgi:hypothetical protein